MSEQLIGAYVQAWVWVEYPEHGAPYQPMDESDSVEAYFRRKAKRRWHRDGEIEIDDNADVSLSYEGG